MLRSTVSLAVVLAGCVSIPSFSDERPDAAIDAGARPDARIGDAGVGADPPMVDAAPPQLYSVGHPSYLGSWGYAGANSRMAQRLAVTETVTLHRLGVIAFQVEEAQLGLYDDDHGWPGGLVAPPAASTPNTANAIEVAPASGIVLAPGWYWVTASFKTTGYVGVSTQVHESLAVGNHTFGTAFPTTFGPGSENPNANRMNFYLVVE